MDAVVDAARLLGWRAVHFRPARTEQGWRTAVQYDGKGWPDLTLVRDRVIFAEIKGDGDRLRPDQQQWIADLIHAGQEVYVWQTVDWTSGRLLGVLNERRAAA